MRSAIIVAVLLLAGCASSDDRTDPEPSPPAEPEPEPEPPEDFSESGPAPAGGLGNCLPNCPTYAFDAEGNASVDITLSWTIPSNDLDLYLLRGGTVVSESIDTPPGTQEHIGTRIGAGSYEIQIVSYASAPDTYDLVVDFE